MQPMENAMKPLEIGDPAPDFVVDPEKGRTLHELIDELQIPALVYFYPADFSPACTAQACMVRNVVRREGAENGIVIGVSPQGGGLHRVFQKVMHLPQRLVSDQSRTIGRLYGAVGNFGLSRRLTFIVGVDKRIALRADAGLLLADHRMVAERYFELAGFKAAE